MAESPLIRIYAVVYLDAIHFKVKQDGAILYNAAYMIIGIELDGNKEVLGMWIGENESSKLWISVLNELKNRVVQDILIICVDNLSGFSQAIAACYPHTEIQKCIIHQIRSSKWYVSSVQCEQILCDVPPSNEKPDYRKLWSGASLLQLKLIFGRLEIKSYLP